MNTKLLIITLTLMTSFLITSCDKDDPVIIDPPELITTVNYTLSPTSGGSDIVLSFRDIDGEDGNAPVITGGTLASNQTYSGSLELLNESVSPVDDITTEIAEEDVDHQFFFSSTLSDLTFAYGDQDAGGFPIGLSSTLTTGASGTGTISIVLKHEPMKSEPGVSDGDITNAMGETDIEVTLPIDVQ